MAVNGSRVNGAAIVGTCQSCPACRAVIQVLSFLPELRCSAKTRALESCLKAPAVPQWRSQST